jgi:hypothetical protein
MIFMHGIIISSREGNVAVRTYNKVLEVYFFSCSDLCYFVGSFE